MSVYTTVTQEEMQQFLNHYDLGTLIKLTGIEGGVTNTNYFVDTTKGRYVLTLFEVLKSEELPFFLELKDFLNQHHIACPRPIRSKEGQFSGYLSGKPCALISCLAGHDVDRPNEAQCFSTGMMLAKMHLAVRDFPLMMENPRGPKWWTQALDRLTSKLSAEDHQLLAEEINAVAEAAIDLPSGIIHADLFKDNVLMSGDEVAGFIDFYYACYGSFVYDMAIAINDWARTEEQTIDPKSKAAFISGYEHIRPLSEEEKAHLMVAQRAGAIRFWVSRLLDFHFPAEGEMILLKEPNVFRDLLIFLRQSAV